MNWTMNGPTVTSQTTLSDPGAAWRLIGTGDFNNDGDADLLFQNKNGTPMIWTVNVNDMNVPTVTTPTTLPNPGSTWHAIGTGDYNGDGKSDILFQNNNGTPLIWTMNGTSVTATVTLPNPGNHWHANSG